MTLTIRCGVFCSILICTFSAYGQTYNKCRDSRGNVSFTDRPCPAGSWNEMTVESVYPPDSVAAPSGAENSNSSQRYLDMKVNEAIGTGDLRRAKELALTPEHWEKIRAAEKPTKESKSEAEIQAEMADSEKCKMAKRDYELAAWKADSFSGNFVAAKKRIMYSACGMKEPTSVNINVFR